MSPLIAAAGCFLLYALGFGVYSRFLSRRIFRLDDNRKTPAHTMTDGIDYVPTKRVVLFGHHYASITGLAPMLGPAVADLGLGACHAVGGVWGDPGRLRA